MKREVRNLRNTLYDDKVRYEDGMRTRSGKELPERAEMTFLHWDTSNLMIKKDFDEALLMKASKEVSNEEKVVNLGKFAEKFEKPVIFKDAWNHPDKFQQSKWIEAIKKEFKKMTNLKVWTKIRRSQKPEDKQCVKMKWVFKIKRDGVF